MSERTIDESVLNEACDGDEEFERDLLLTFLETASEEIDRLSCRLEAGDFDGMEKSAHFIKGGARSIGATSLADCACLLESAARDENLTAVQALVPLIVNAYGAVESWISDHFGVSRVA